MGTERLKRKISSSLDWQLCFAILSLCLVGLGVLYSASYDPDSPLNAQFRRQAMSMGIGVVAFLTAFLMGPQVLRRWSWLVYIGTNILLVLVLFFGDVGGGAARWLEIGSLRLQPSELSKVGLILALARIFSSDSAPRDGYSFTSIWIPLLVIGLPSVLVLVEPDLGTALCHVLIGGSMLLVAGVRWKTLATFFMAGLLLLIPAYGSLEAYQRKRIVTFLSPEDDPLGAGYHAIQSKIAVGSGALTGKGYLQGTQTQLRFLPEQTTDFIFSVLAEEWGFLGSVFVLILYAFLLTRLVRISYRSYERFGTFAAFGVATYMFWHIIVNIGMVSGVLPVVGLTLPLLSFGGTSVLSFMVALGIAATAKGRRFTFSR